MTALPGQVTTIKAYFDKPGRLNWHCRILAHEDHEMMRVFHVGPLPADNKESSCQPSNDTESVPNVQTGPPVVSKNPPYRPEDEDNGIRHIRRREKDILH